MWTRTHTHTTRYQNRITPLVNALTCNVGQALALWATTPSNTLQITLGGAIPTVSGNAVAYMPVPTETIHFANGLSLAHYEKN